MEAQNHQLSSASAPSIPSRRVDDDVKRLRAHEERILDEALAATFPCSDPISSLSVDDVFPDEDEEDAPPPPSSSKD